MQFTIDTARMAARARQLVLAGLIFALGSPASAQYFGRNKVRYRAFDFQVMRTDHFDIYFYPSEREGVDIAARLAERWYTRLSRQLNHSLSERQPLVLYASHADFEQTNVVSEEINEGTGGFTEPIRRRIVLPMAGPIADTDHVLGHELVHAFQFDMAVPTAGDSQQTPLDRLPLWFVEGMAEYLSLGRVDAHAAMKVRDAAARNQLPTIVDLRSPKYFPYQWGHAVFAYIGGRYGDQSIPRLFRSAALTGNVEDAIQSTLGISVQDLSRDWHAAINQLYGPGLASATPLPTRARLDFRARFAADLNVAPALSPDGKWLAFLSTRSLFSTDLYIAEAQTGRVVRRLTSTATDPHFSSIEFINSAAAWDRSSKHVAIGTITGGRAALAIFDTRSGKRDREIPVKDVDEILNPSWAPDGHAIAFTGMRAGLTDLYVYEFSGSRVRQLTNDPYADLHPAWSPDSRRIAYATDRYSSSLDELRMGPLRLAILNPANGGSELVPTFDTGKAINPQWTANGDGLYFIGNPQGVPNIYRVSIATGQTAPMTAVGVGISGITPSSPAFSVSAATEELAVSTYENERYAIYLWSASDPVDPPPPLLADAAALPPPDDSSPGLRALAARRDPIPTIEGYPTVPYSAKMSLVGVGQPTATAGVTSFGPMVAGSATFTFADALGDRILSTGLQVGSGLTNSFSFKDVAFQAGYLRLDRRWQWRLVTGQIPYVAGTFESGSGIDANGQAVQVDRQTIYREVERNTAAILMYPLDRARRLEFAGGFAQSSLEQIVNSTVSTPGGQLLSTGQDVHDLRPQLNLATTTAAFVSDAATVGPTSPIQGQRYRVEVTPTFGTVNFTGLLADYRRYIMPVSFYTIATRFITYSRLGPGGDDLRLNSIFINDPSLIRGYAPLTQLPVGCIATLTLCNPADQLVGSRIAVGNLEFRFPLLRPFGVKHGMYGPVPIEVAFFGDSGVAWNGGEKPAIFGGTRQQISSSGVAFRVGLGFAVAEFDAVKPFQRADTGWTFGFNLIPGW
ncbi:MAG TPA: BamA/TamA family outer membrane protein [Vicinamibacterales bacterium]